jgi:hypothetical protein
MDFGALAELGVTGMLVVAVIMLIDFIKRKFRDGEKGDRRLLPRVIDCPNKVEGLAATMVALCNESREQTRLNTEQLRVIQHNMDGIDRLVDQHKPGLDGREMWKMSTRSEKVQEESRDLLRELVAVVKKNGFK